MVSFYQSTKPTQLQSKQGNKCVLIAGDASFSLDQVKRQAVAGICEDIGTARQTLAVIAEQIEQNETAYLAAHDPAAGVEA